MSDSRMHDKKVLYIDMDGVIADFDSAFELLDPTILEEFRDNTDQIPGLFALMTPIPGAIEAVTELSTLFDTYVLSTVPWKNTSGASQKIEWIQHHFGTDKDSPLWKRVILSHHKHLNRGDFLIDDRPESNGAREFEVTNEAGKLIHFGSAEFPNWDAVLGYLRPRARDRTNDHLEDHNGAPTNDAEGLPAGARSLDSRGTTIRARRRGVVVGTVTAR